MSKTWILLQEGEQIIREERAAMLESKWRAYFGRLALTDRRLIFVRDRTVTFAALGVFGGLLGMLMKGKTAFDQPRGALAVSRGSLGRNKEVLAVKAPDAEVRFILQTPYSEWEQALLGASR